MFHSPINIKFFRGTKLSVRWVVESARLRRARTMARRLALELLDARKSMGHAFRKKQALHKLADAHRAFKRKKKKWWNRPSVPPRWTPRPGSPRVPKRGTPRPKRVRPKTGYPAPRKPSVTDQMNPAQGRTNPRPSLDRALKLN